MDVNQILSFLQEAIRQSDQSEAAQTNPQQTQLYTAPAIPSIQELSSISQDVIQQVREEYMGQQATDSQLQSKSDAKPTEPESLDQLLDSLSNATLITPEVLLAVGRMSKETNLLQVLRDCKQSQEQKERELQNRRQQILDRHQKQKDALFAKELVGAANAGDWKTFEKQAAEELKRMDIHIIREMDKEVQIQQRKFQKLRVPFFKVTSNPSDIKLQHKILSILLDMIGD